MADSAAPAFDTAAILKEEYVALRAEICQSIAQQHRILLSGYAAASATLGVVMGSSAVGPKALFLVPLILLAMVALWAVECNRMVRASYYIGYTLWPELCRAAGRAADTGWESWIRIRAGAEGGFRRRQHLFQLIAVVYIPFAVSVATTGVAGVFACDDDRWLLLLASTTAFTLPIWLLVYANVRRISNLGGVGADPSVAPRPASASESQRT